MSESHGLKGCTNHGCFVQPKPKGSIGTNAICQCLRRDGYLSERLVNWLRSEIAAKDERIAELEAALKAIKALQRWDSPEYGPEPYRDDQGAFVIFDDVDDIIEEALR